ncbi:MAG: hypothetical protein R3E88_21615 [Myxococcota bacterium]
MTSQSKTPSAASLGAALAAVGRELGARESEHAAALDAARAKATELHAHVERALADYHEAIEAAGAPQLRVEIGAPRLDEKHVRSWEFELRRGRWRALFIAKSRGEVTLVGPFRTGKNEGPCKSLPSGAPGERSPELDAALVAFVTHFLEEAATP